MKRSWIFVMGVLGLVATSCSGFTVERSNLGSFDFRNWSVPVLHLNRRNPVEKMFSDDFQSADIENILRDTEMRQFVKMPEKKCSSSSESLSERLKRADNVLDSTNHSPIIEKSVAELGETTIGSSISDVKISGSTIVTSPEELKSSEPLIDTWPKEARNLDSIILTSPKETNISEPAIASSPEKSKSPTWTIVSSYEEIKPSNVPVETINQETKIPELTLKKSLDSQILKNVILLLIDDPAVARDNYFKSLRDYRMFSVHRLLQNCYGSRLSKLPRTHPLMDPWAQENCECDRLLRSNIASLLSWARHKEMTTGTISSTNFSIPLPLGYESPANPLVKEFEDTDEEVNEFHQEVSRSKSDSNRVWHLIDIEKQSTIEKESSSSVSATPSLGSLSKAEGVNGFDGMWNVLDMLSRIRIAFFRILLESLGNMAGTEDELNGKRSLPLQPTFVEMMTDAIREFKLVQNDNGFILVAAGPENAWSDAIEVLQREMLTKDTLLVVSGVCSPSKHMPLVARGPGERLFRDARTVWDVPELIERAMSDGCLENSCKQQRTEKVVALPSLELSVPPEPPRKRVGRATQKAEVNETSVTNTTSTKKPADVPEREKEAKPAISMGIEGKSGGAAVNNVAKVLAIGISFLTMLVLNSS